MVRARRGHARRQAKKRYFKLAKGNVGGRRRLLRLVKQAILRAGRFAFRDRRVKRRDLRRLWILRINAACRQRGTRYSVFIHGIQKAGVALNRKMMAYLAYTDPAAFDQLVAISQSESEKAKAKS